MRNEIIEAGQIILVDEEHNHWNRYATLLRKLTTNKIFKDYHLERWEIEFEDGTRINTNIFAVDEDKRH